MLSSHALGQRHRGRNKWCTVASGTGCNAGCPLLVLQVEAEVSEQLLKEMEEMGFPRCGRGGSTVRVTANGVPLILCCTLYAFWHPYAFLPGHSPAPFL